MDIFGFLSLGNGAFGALHEADFWIEKTGFANKVLIKMGGGSGEGSQPDPF